jgi:hypothetical protein
MFSDKYCSYIKLLRPLLFLNNVVLIIFNIELTGEVGKTEYLLRSLGLWRWYINITITILDIIHRPVFYLKHNSTL